LILHLDWINAGSTFKSGYNCIGVSNGEELAQFIEKGLSEKEYKNILMNSKKILENIFNMSLYFEDNVMELMD
jgi:hypothetical protein